MPAKSHNGGATAHAPSAAHAEEETPLLSEANTAVEDPTDEDPRLLYRQNVQILVFGLLFLFGFGAAIISPPMNEIGEGILCRKYHPDVFPTVRPDDPNSICKSQDVQQALAMIRGWGATFDCIPGTIMAVPFGILSDKWGRRPVLVLSILGINLQIASTAVVMALPQIFPLQMLWATSFMMLIGGGAGVLIAMLYTFMSDVTPPASRTSAFSQIGAAFLLSSLVGSIVAPLVMKHSAWLAYFLGFGILLFSNLLAMVLPETKYLHEEARRRTSEASLDAAHERGELEPAKKSGLLGYLQQGRTTAVEALSFITTNKRVSLLTLALAFVVIAKFSVDFLLLQYASRRFHWTWSTAAFLISISNAGNVAVLLAGLPAVSWILLTRFHMPAIYKDLVITRASSLLLILGFCIIAFADNGTVIIAGLIVSSCGNGIPFMLRSLTNSLIEDHHLGILNTVIGLTENVGIMVGSPVLSALLGKGFALGGMWTGLPFLAGALLFCVAAVIVFAVPAPTAKLDADEEATVSQAAALGPDDAL